MRRSRQEDLSTRKLLDTTGLSPGQETGARMDQRLHHLGYGGAGVQSVENVANNWPTKQGALHTNDLGRVSSLKEVA